MPSGKLDSQGSVLVIVLAIIGIVLIGLGLLFIKPTFFQNSNISEVLPHQPQELTKVKTIASSGGGSELIALVVKKYNLDKKYGIDVEYAQDDPGDLERVLMEGTYDFVSTSTLIGAEAYLKNNHIRIVGPLQRMSRSVVVPVDSSIKTLHDLKGKKFGTLAKSTAAYSGMAMVFKSAGVDPEKDLKLVFGNNDELNKLLEAREIDAGMVSYPLRAKLIAQGKFKDILALDDIWKNSEDGYSMPIVAMMASDKWYQNNKQVAASYLKAFYEAVNMIQKDPSLIASFPDYLKKHKMEQEAVIKIVQEKVPPLLYNQYSQQEYEGFKRYYEKAIEHQLIPDNSPRIEEIIVTPQELGFTN